MDEYMYGRYTTLNKLKSVRDDPFKPKFTRQQAANSMDKIMLQMKDQKLLGLRERLIKATKAHDLYEVHKIENQLKAHEGQEIETHE